MARTLTSRSMVSLQQPSNSILEMPGAVLSDSDPPAVVSEAFEKAVKPSGYIGASPAHEIDFAVGDYERFEHDDLLAEFFRKAIGIDSIVAVVEPIFYLRAREILYHGAAHSELIEIVVGEMLDNLSHVETCFISSAGRYTFDNTFAKQSVCRIS